MTVSRAVPAAIARDGARRLPRWALEAMLLLGLYLTGELARGVARGGEPSAEAHAAFIVRLERRLHVFDEATIQHAAGHVVGLPTFLGYAYVSVHLAGTAAVLVWVYRRRRDEYARLRNTLALASWTRSRRLCAVPGGAAATRRPRHRGHGQRCDLLESRLVADLEPLQPVRGGAEHAHRLLAHRRYRGGSTRAPHRCGASRAPCIPSSCCS